MGHVGVTWLTFGILGTPYNISQTVAARNFKFGTETDGSATERNAKLRQKGSCGVTWPTFGILGPPYISGTVEARNFKFGKESDRQKLSSCMLVSSHMNEECIASGTAFTD